MKERPILFSDGMVGAILTGTKTQTRRVMKPQPIKEVIDFARAHITSTYPNTENEWRRGLASCPYGRPGERLWVREAHYIIGEHPGPTPGTRWVHYRADASTNLGSDECQWTGPWKPSIHMPRWASRILLEVTDVRVECLMDISADDAEAEGWPGPNKEESRRSYYPIEWFANLWDSLNAKRGFGWDANPWVWVIKFKRI